MIEKSYINSVDDVVKTTTDTPDSLHYGNESENTSSRDVNESLDHNGTSAMDFNLVTQNEKSPDYAGYLAQQTVHVRKYKLKK